VNTFEADMGGTNIIEPLEAVFNMNRKKNFPRHVFLLTDGDVDNPKLVTNIIKKNAANNRVHSIGVGSGAS
jgi:hypothetical protein